MAWLNKNILLLSLSAFFADSGYQMIIAGLPLFIVLYLHEPVYIFGIATALGYGGGALFSYLGGILADRYGRKKMAILGNSLIPILSFTGFASNAVEAISVFSTGWWARNFRTPARRAMLSDEANPENKAKVFGFLHALDIGGTLTAVTLLSILLYINLKFNIIFLVSIIPITISTLCILFVKEKKHIKNKKSMDKTDKADSKLFRGVLLSTMLYGFSFYSMGFPVLTIAQKSTDIYGVLTYGAMMLVSALAGYFLGSINSISKTKALAYLGYG
ncbi:MAG: MFS transporter, partial [Thermoplasmata archaeon]